MENNVRNDKRLEETRKERKDKKKKKRQQADQKELLSETLGHLSGVVFICWSDSPKLTGEAEKLPTNVSC